MVRYVPLLSAAAAVVAADQTTKQLALDHLSDGPIHIVDGALSLRLTFNAGGAFGLGRDFPEIFLVAAAAVVVLILVWARTVRERHWLVALGLVLGGGIGNLADRVLRDFEGRVVDFIDLHVWPVFNLADSAIVTGAGLILLFGARAKKTEET